MTRERSSDRERSRERRPEATAFMSSRIPIGLTQSYSPVYDPDKEITKYHERHRLAPQVPGHLCWDKSSEQPIHISCPSHRPNAWMAPLSALGQITSVAPQVPSTF